MGIRSVSLCLPFRRFCFRILLPIPLTENKEAQVHGAQDSSHVMVSFIFHPKGDRQSAKKDDPYPGTITDDWLPCPWFGFEHLFSSITAHFMCLTEANIRKQFWSKLRKIMFAVEKKRTSSTAHSLTCLAARMDLNGCDCIKQQERKKQGGRKERGERKLAVEGE